MKYILISLLCLIIIISIWFCFYYFSISSAYEFFSTNLDMLSDFVLQNEYNEAYELTVKIMSEWDKIEKVWVFFVHQEDIDSIRASINKLYRSIEVNSTVYSLGEIEQLMSLIIKVRGNECLTLENIF
ncbi:DUF4363 family protein [Sedimentibacter sp. zth1]|uniref:DUF4363 family protein n=1 Tax=Sedimentibacter sp. zth1 TaxID=2816908 RepID=UPI001A931075|nr:DUF4363 family protein [Sedimentibacter sp. zth1]QSX07048.1 DUF4363 family protein [Sedimentibacter sp. zth1]